MTRFEFNELTKDELINLINSEIEFDEDGNDGNGLNESDILTKDLKDIYNYIYGG